MSSATVLIREFQPGDRPALQALVQSTFRDLFGDVLPTDELDVYVEDYQQVDTTRTCYVADVSGTLIGYAVARPALQGQTSASTPIERLYLRHTLGDAPQHLTSDLAPDWSIDRSIASALVNALSSPTDSNALAMYDHWGFIDTQVFRRCLSLPSGQGRLL